MDQIQPNQLQLKETMNYFFHNYRELLLRNYKYLLHLHLLPKTLLQYPKPNSESEYL